MIRLALSVIGTLTLACSDPADSTGADASSGDHDAPVATDAGVSLLQVSMGGDHACALRDGVGYCWGNNEVGQVRSPASDKILLPTPIGGASDVIAVRAGTVGKTCVARSSGTTECWGSGLSGVVPVSGLDGAIDLVNASRTWCGRRANGEVRCWGDGNYGALGDGTSISRDDARPATLPEPAIDLHASYLTVCAVGASGAVYCWGAGYGATPILVEDLTPAVRVATGGTYDSAVRVHVCALRDDGRVFCRGNNTYGQLARPATDRPTTAVEITGVSGATSIDAGGSSTQAVVAGGTLRCWGTPCGQSVMPVEGVANVIALSYRGHSCAVFGDDVIRCWGANHYGQLGDGTTEDRAVPTPISW